jgi:hypothetical protein
MRDVGKRACILFFASGCVASPEPQDPQASGNRAIVPTHAGRGPRHPRFTADCPVPTPDAPFRAGELILAHGSAPNPMFRVKSLVYVVNGQVLFNRVVDSNREHEIPSRFVVLREVAPNKRYTVQVTVLLEGMGPLRGYKFLIPNSHSFLSDGTQATCVDARVGFTDDSSLPNRPYVSFTEVLLPVNQK